MGGDAPPGYEAVRRVGEGCFGTVHLVRRLSDGKLRACKRVPFAGMDAAEKAQLVEEVNILREARHPNLVAYHGHHVDRKEQAVYLLTEYCPGGDLAGVVSRAREAGQRIDEDYIWAVAGQLAAALAYCHGAERGRRVLHRDLKPGNVLVGEGGRIRLCDFGLARVLRGERDLARSTVGTPHYMSPEVVSEEPYGEASDMWSLGCLLHEMAALRRPFRGSSPRALAGRIRVARPARLPALYSRALQALVDALLSASPRRRPDAASVAALPACLRAERRRLETVAGELERRERALLRRERQLAAAATPAVVADTPRRRRRRRQQLLHQRREPPAAARRLWPPAVKA